NRVLTFSTFVYTRATSTGELPQYGIIGAMSGVLIVIALLGTLYYGRLLGRSQQYQVVTGRGYQPREMQLGPWRLLAWALIGAYLGLGQLLPLLLLVWAAGLPFFQPFSMEALGQFTLRNFLNLPLETVLRGARHTLVLMLVVPTVAIVLSFCLSWMIVRSRSRFRTALDFFAFLPHAIPGIIFGVGAVVIALFVLKGLALYGTLALLGSVYVVERIG